MDLTESEFLRRVEGLKDLLSPCVVCPRKCGVDRLSGERGECGAGYELKVGSVFSHFGEEPPLVGTGGSGTVFLSFCNLACEYCQNFELSHRGRGNIISDEELADDMVRLQKSGCHNINWVSPTHFVPQLVESLFKARRKGLKISVVYNTGGYDHPQTLKLLDGIVDIYMPDMKYGDNEMGRKYSEVSDYWDVNKEAVKEMHRQVGDLRLDPQRIARRGLLIRHLVLPNDIANSSAVLDFIAREISLESYVNIMNQYRPCFHGHHYKKLQQPTSGEEFESVVRTARKFGLHRGFRND